MPDRGAAGAAGRADVHLEIRVVRGAKPADYADIVGRAAAEAFVLAAIRAEHPIDRALPRDAAARGVMSALAGRFAAALGAPGPDERARRHAALAARRDVAAVLFALGTSRRALPGRTAGLPPEEAWRLAFRAAFDADPAPGLEASVGFALDDTLFASGEDALARLVEGGTARAVEAELKAGRAAPAILEAGGLAAGLASDLASRRGLSAPRAGTADTSAPPKKERAVY